MKELVKRLLIILVALGLNVPSFANSMVQVPSQHGGFKVGIDALYLRPNNSDLTYATVLLPFPDDEVNFEKNAMIEPNYRWGIYAQIDYLFPYTGNDLTLGYTRFHTDPSNSIRIPVDEDGNLFITVLPLADLFSQFGRPEFTTFENVTGKATFNLDTVDLEGGQRFTTGTFDMRMFAGVRGTKIDHTLESFANSDINILGEVVYTAFGNQTFKSDFRGIGPRIGVDSRYSLGSGFGLDAQLSASLLIGQITSSYNARAELVVPGAFTVEGQFQSARVDKSRVVPNIDAKLGLDYTYPINAGCNYSALVFEAGYQTSSYFNAIDHAETVATTGTSFAYQGTTTDVTFDGIYVGLKYYA